MDPIRLSNAGLQTVASRHVASAAAVAGGVPLGGSGAPGQATSAAVTATNALIGSAANSLAARLTTTASKISTAGAVMTEQDHAAEQRLVGLRPTVWV